jgi:hypothetical protein
VHAGLGGHFFRKIDSDQVAFLLRQGESALTGPAAQVQYIQRLVRMRSQHCREEPRCVISERPQARIEGRSEIVEGGTDPAIGSAVGDLAGCSGEIMTKQGGVQAGRDCAFIELGRLSHLAVPAGGRDLVREFEVRTEIKRASECLLSFRGAAKQLQG